MGFTPHMDPDWQNCLGADWAQGRLVKIDLFGTIFAQVRIESSTADTEAWKEYV